MGISKNHLSILIISFTIACFFIFISETTYYTKFLHLYNIDHLSPTFIDFRSYQSLVETVEAGFNPYIEHPFDPKLRPFNLPYIWFYISKFIYLKSEIIFKFVVLLFIFLYVNSSLQIASIYKNLKHKIFIYFLLFSSSSMLLVERGNTDMLIYGLIFYSAYNFNFSRSVFFLSLASILKLYPIFAFTLNFYKKKKIFLLHYF